MNNAFPSQRLPSEPSNSTNTSQQTSTSQYPPSSLQSHHPAPQHPHYIDFAHQPLNQRLNQPSPSINHPQLIHQLPQQQNPPHVDHSHIINNHGSDYPHHHQDTTNTPNHTTFLPLAQLDAAPPQHAATNFPPSDSQLSVTSAYFHHFQAHFPSRPTSRGSHDLGSAFDPTDPVHTAIHPDSSMVSYCNPEFDDFLFAPKPHLSFEKLGPISNYQLIDIDHLGQLFSPSQQPHDFEYINRQLNPHLGPSSNPPQDASESTQPKTVLNLPPIIAFPDTIPLGIQPVFSHLVQTHPAPDLVRDLTFRSDALLSTSIQQFKFRAHIAMDQDLFSTTNSAILHSHNDFHNDFAHYQDCHFSHASQTSNTVEFVITDEYSNTENLTNPDAPSHHNHRLASFSLDMYSDGAPLQPNSETHDQEHDAEIHVPVPPLSVENGEFASQFNQSGGSCDDLLHIGVVNGLNDDDDQYDHERAFQSQNNTNLVQIHNHHSETKQARNDNKKSTADRLDSPSHQAQNKQSPNQSTHMRLPNTTPKRTKQYKQAKSASKNSFLHSHLHHTDQSQHYHTIETNSSLSQQLPLPNYSEPATITNTDLIPTSPIPLHRDPTDLSQYHHPRHQSSFSLQTPPQSTFIPIAHQSPSAQSSSSSSLQHHHHHHHHAHSRASGINRNNNNNSPISPQSPSSSQSPPLSQQYSTHNSPHCPQKGTNDFKHCSAPQQQAVLGTKLSIPILTTKPSGVLIGAHRHSQKLTTPIVQNNKGEIFFVHNPSFPLEYTEFDPSGHFVASSSTVQSTSSCRTFESDTNQQHYQDLNNQNNNALNETQVNMHHHLSVPFPSGSQPSNISSIPMPQNTNNALIGSKPSSQTVSSDSLLAEFGAVNNSKTQLQSTPNFETPIKITPNTSAAAWNKSQTASNATAQNSNTNTNKPGFPSFDSLSPILPNKTQPSQSQQQQQIQTAKFGTPFSLASSSTITPGQPLTVSTNILPPSNSTQKPITPTLQKTSPLSNPHQPQPTSRLPPSPLQRQKKQKQPIDPKHQALMLAIFTEFDVDAKTFDPQLYDGLIQLSLAQQTDLAKLTTQHLISPHSPSFCQLQPPTLQTPHSSHDILNSMLNDLQYKYTPDIKPNFDILIKCKCPQKPPKEDEEDLREAPKAEQHQHQHQDAKHDVPRTPSPDSIPLNAGKQMMQERSLGPNLTPMKQAAGNGEGILLPEECSPQRGVFSSPFSLKTQHTNQSTAPRGPRESISQTLITQSHSDAMLSSSATSLTVDSRDCHDCPCFELVKYQYDIIAKEFRAGTLRHDLLASTHQSKPIEIKANTKGDTKNDGTPVNRHSQAHSVHSNVGQVDEHKSQKTGIVSLLGRDVTLPSGILSEPHRFISPLSKSKQNKQNVEGQAPSPPPCFTSPSSSQQSSPTTSYALLAPKLNNISSDPHRHAISIFTDDEIRKLLPYLDKPLQFVPTLGLTYIYPHVIYDIEKDVYAPPIHHGQFARYGMQEMRRGEDQHQPVHNQSIMDQTSFSHFSPTTQGSGSLLRQSMQDFRNHNGSYNNNNGPGLGSYEGLGKAKGSHHLYQPSSHDYRYTQGQSIVFGEFSTPNRRNLNQSNSPNELILGTPTKKKVGSVHTSTPRSTQSGNNQRKFKTKTLTPTKSRSLGKRHVQLSISRQNSHHAIVHGSKATTLVSPLNSFNANVLDHHRGSPVSPKLSRNGSQEQRMTLTKATSPRLPTQQGISPVTSAGIKTPTHQSTALFRASSRTYVEAKNSNNDDPIPLRPTQSHFGSTHSRQQASLLLLGTTPPQHTTTIALPRQLTETSDRAENQSETSSVSSNIQSLPSKQAIASDQLKEIASQPIHEGPSQSPSSTPTFSPFPQNPTQHPSNNSMNEIHLNDRLSEETTHLLHVKLSCSTVTRAETPLHLNLTSQGSSNQTSHNLTNVSHHFASTPFTPSTSFTPTSQFNNPFTRNSHGAGCVLSTTPSTPAQAAATTSSAQFQQTHFHPNNRSSVLTTTSQYSNTSAPPAFGQLPLPQQFQQHASNSSISASTSLSALESLQGSPQFPSKPKQPNILQPVDEQINPPQLPIDPKQPTAAADYKFQRYFQKVTRDIISSPTAQDKGGKRDSTDKLEKRGLGAELELFNNSNPTNIHPQRRRSLSAQKTTQNQQSAAQTTAGLAHVKFLEKQATVPFQQLTLYDPDTNSQSGRNNTSALVSPTASQYAQSSTHSRPSTTQYSQSSNQPQQLSYQLYQGSKPSMAHSSIQQQLRQVEVPDNDPDDFIISSLTQGVSTIQLHTHSYQSVTPKNQPHPPHPPHPHTRSQQYLLPPLVIPTSSSANDCKLSYPSHHDSNCHSDHHAHRRNSGHKGTLESDQDPRALIASPSISELSQTSLSSQTRSPQITLNSRIPSNHSNQPSFYHNPSNHNNTPHQTPLSQHLLLQNISLPQPPPIPASISHHSSLQNQTSTHSLDHPNQTSSSLLTSPNQLLTSTSFCSTHQIYTYDTSFQASQNHHQYNDMTENPTSTSSQGSVHQHHYHNRNSSSTNASFPAQPPPNDSNAFYQHQTGLLARNPSAFLSDTASCSQPQLPPSASATNLTTSLKKPIQTQVQVQGQGQGQFIYTPNINMTPLNKIGSHLVHHNSANPTPINTHPPTPVSAASPAYSRPVTAIVEQTHQQPNPFQTPQQRHSNRQVFFSPSHINQPPERTTTTTHYNQTPTNQQYRQSSQTSARMSVQQGQTPLLNPYAPTDGSFVSPSVATELTRSHSLLFQNDNAMEYQYNPPLDRSHHSMNNLQLSHDDHETLDSTGHDTQETYSLHNTLSSNDINARRSAEQYSDIMTESTVHHHSSKDIQYNRESRHQNQMSPIIGSHHISHRDPHNNNNNSYNSSSNNNSYNNNNSNNSSYNNNNNSSNIYRFQQPTQRYPHNTNSGYQPTIQQQPLQPSLLQVSISSNVSIPSTSSVHNNSTHHTNPTTSATILPQHSSHLPSTQYSQLLSTPTNSTRLTVVPPSQISAHFDDMPHQHHHAHLLSPHSTQLAPKHHSHIDHNGQPDSKPPNHRTTFFSPQMGYAKPSLSKNNHPSVPQTSTLIPSTISNHTVSTPHQQLQQQPQQLPQFSRMPSVNTPNPSEPRSHRASMLSEQSQQSHMSSFQLPTSPLYHATNSNDNHCHFGDLNHHHHTSGAAVAHFAIQPSKNITPVLSHANHHSTNHHGAGGHGNGNPTDIPQLYTHSHHNFSSDRGSMTFSDVTQFTTAHTTNTRHTTHTGHNHHQQHYGHSDLDQLGSNLTSTTPCMDHINGTSTIDRVRANGGNPSSNITPPVSHNLSLNNFSAYPAQPHSTQITTHLQTTLNSPPGTDQNKRPISYRGSLPG